MYQPPGHHNKTSQWSKISGLEIAQVLYQITNGNKKPLLLRRVDLPNTVWTRAESLLFPNAEPDIRNRWFICNAWAWSWKSTVAHFESLCNKPSSRRQRSTQNEEDDIRAHCFCQRRFKTVSKVPVIKCDRCHRVLHTICAGIAKQDIVSGKPIICRICTDHLEVPSLFDDSNAGEPEDQLGLLEDGELESDEETVTASNPELELDLDADLQIFEDSLHENDWNGEQEPSSFGSFRSSEIEGRVQRFGDHDNQDDKAVDTNSDNEDETHHHIKSNTTTTQSWQRSPPKPMGKGLPRNSDSPNNSMESSAQRSSQKSTSTRRGFQSLSQRGSDKAPRTSTPQTSPFVKGSRAPREVNFREDVQGLRKIPSPPSSDERGQVKHGLPSKPSTSTSVKNKKIGLSVRTASILSLSGSKLSRNRQRDRDAPRPKCTKNDSSDDDHQWPKGATQKEPIDDEEYAAGADNRFSDTDQNNSEEENIPEETTSGFVFYLTHDVWRSILVKVAAKKFSNLKGSVPYVWDLKSEYTNVFSDKFRVKKKGCVLAFKRKTINQPGSRGTFIKTNAKCTQSTCTAEWTFAVEELPKPGQDMRVVVHYHNGNIDHSGPKIHARRLSGSKKTEMYDALRHKKAASERKIRLANADKVALKLGNFTEVPSMNAMRKIRSNIAKEGDEDDHPLVDLLRTMEKLKQDHEHPLLSGYIQFVAANPLVVIAYTHEQLQIVKKIVNCEDDLMLQMDGTGAIMESLPSPMDTTSGILYTLVKRSPNRTPLPILEFVLGESTTTNVQFCLNHFMNNLKTITRISLTNCGIRKIEVDFSLGLVSGLSLVFNKCSTSETLQGLWKLCTTGMGYDGIGIHVCKWHLGQAMQRKVAQCFGHQPTYVQQNILSWNLRLRRSRDMATFHNLIHILANLCGFEQETPKVRKAMDDLVNPTPTYDEFPWLDFVPSNFDDPTAPLYRCSPFGEYADLVFSEVQHENAGLQNYLSGQPTNHYYSPDYIKYIKVHVIPFYPIISCAIFEALNLPMAEEDTTSVIEAYHGVLKNNYHDGKQKHRISRFFRKQHTFILGSVTEYETEVLNKKSRKPKTKQKAAPTTYTNQNQSEASSQNRNVSQALQASKKGTRQQDPCTTTTRGKQGKESPDPKLPEECLDTFKKVKKRVPSVSQLESTFDIAHVTYGGFFERNGQRVNLRYTCNYDTFLQILQFLYVKNATFRGFIDMSDEEHQVNIRRCMTFIEMENFGMAKKVWLLDVLGLDDITNRLQCERIMGYDAIAHWFPVKKKYECLNDQCKYSGRYYNTRFLGRGTEEPEYDHNAGQIYAGTVEQFLAKINSVNSETLFCPACKQELLITYDINLPHPFFVYCLDGGEETYTQERNLPMIQTIKNDRFKVFAYTLRHPPDEDTVEHLTATILYNDKRWRFDGLQDRPYQIKPLSDDKVTTVWLCKLDTTFL